MGGGKGMHCLKRKARFSLNRISKKRDVAERVVGRRKDGELRR